MHPTALMLALGLGAVLVCAVTAADAAPSAVTVANLRCEYLTDPLGIDTAQPRLSWQMADPAHARGQRQRAYRILVASSPSALEQDRGDLWDSRKVASAQSVGVVYGGAPLTPGRTCWWKAQMWDKDNRASAWSGPARFSVGLLQPADWSARWIGMADADENACPWFRKTFSLDAVPETALAYVGSIGFHELYVNGRRVGDQVLTPSVSDLEKRALYLTYDVRPYLRPGKNAIALWLAPGWAQFTDANPPVGFHVEKKPLGIAQLQLGPAQGPFTTVASDESWRCSPSSTRHLGSWHNGNFGGDRVDGGKDTPGWSAADFDDGAWAAATVYQPGRALSPDTIEPNRKGRPVAAKEVTQVAPGKYRFVMDRLYTGWVEVKLAGTPGSKVTVKVSSLPQHEVEYNQLSEYVLGPSGEGTFCNRFSYHECHYVTIEGLTHEPALSDVVGYPLTNDRARIGSFDCSNALLKRIYDTTVNTYVGLTTGGMTVDCPHRERLGYGGDGHTSLELALDTFQSDPFFAKWAQDWCDIQEPSGRILHTAPTMGGGGGPGWSGFVITMPWEVYQAYGDTRILEKTYPHGRRWLDFMEAHRGADGLVAALPGGYWFFLGDWVTPHGSEGSDSVEAVLFNNCYYLYAIRLAAKTARVLGKPDEARELDARADTLRQAINRRFYKPAEHAYLDTRQTHLVLPLIAGAVAPDDVPGVVRTLEQEILARQKGHLDTGLHGTYFMTKYLAEHDRSDLVFTYATQTTFPSYGDLLAKGYETWPEEWAGAPSIMHGCLNGIGGWFQRGLAGIRPDPADPGYQRFLIKPAIVGDVTWVKASHESMYGSIVSEWSLENGRYRHTVQVPPNTTATVYVPAAKAAAITEAGRPISRAPGAKVLRTEPGWVVLQLTAGRYELEAAR